MSPVDDSVDPAAFLASAVEQARQRFAEEKALLSFQEYLEVLAGDPKGQARDAAAYIRDAFLYYGTEQVKRPYGELRRFKLFDCPFDGGRDALIGHERVQDEVFGLLSDFVEEGAVSKLILLHGPNGSAKSSFISCVFRGLEDYSRQPEGALYTFSWVFPRKRPSGGSIGFGGSGGVEALETFAHLHEADVDARIQVETRDHPLLLLPRAARLRLLRSLLGEDARLPRSVTEGELSPKARQVYDALLKAHQGDLSEVLKHVQVERFHISRRYRHGAVTVDPQMRVDAGVRQLTADRSLASLPPSLQTITLYEPVGDLVDANRGLIEFNDLLKRPVEAFKYLLSTCENRTVRLETMTLYLDSVFIGSCNAKHLEAFKEMPDFASFKGRIELVQVPYLMDPALERHIYTQMFRATRVEKPVAPHTEQVAALWAVMTRLRRPQAEPYPQQLRATVRKLSPLEKALLYANGATPAGLARDVANSLHSHIGDLHRERATLPDYEGRFGASPREINAALLAAARRPGALSVTPTGLLEELDKLCQQSSVYEFLRLKPDGDYHQPAKYLETLRDWYMTLLEEELHQAMGLVDRNATADLFARYVDNVMHDVRGEKRHNPVTGRYDDPDQRLLRDVEERLGVPEKEVADYRAGVMHRIAAWRMDNPEAPLDYELIFTERMARLNDAFYEEKRKVADRIKSDLLTYLTHGAERLNEEARTRVETTLASLQQDFGYESDSAMEVVGHLLKWRARS